MSISGIGGSIGEFAMVVKSPREKAAESTPPPPKEQPAPPAKTGGIDITA